jgi:hypothetical protein
MVSRDLVPVVASKRGTIVSAIVNPLGRGTDPSYGFMERFANVTPQNKKGLRVLHRSPFICRTQE